MINLPLKLNLYGDEPDKVSVKDSFLFLFFIFFLKGSFLIKENTKALVLTLNFYNIRIRRGLWKYLNTYINLHFFSHVGIWAILIEAQNLRWLFPL